MERAQHRGYPSENKNEITPQDPSVRKEEAKNRQPETKCRIPIGLLGNSQGPAQARPMQVGRATHLSSEATGSRGNRTTVELTSALSYKALTKEAENGDKPVRVCLSPHCQPQLSLN